MTLVIAHICPTTAGTGSGSGAVATGVAGPAEVVLSRLALSCCPEGRGGTEGVGSQCGVQPLVVGRGERRAARSRACVRPEGEDQGQGQQRRTDAGDRTGNLTRETRKGPLDRLRAVTASGHELSLPGRVHRIRAA